MHFYLIEVSSEKTSVFLGCLSVKAKHSDHRLNFKTEANISELVKMYFIYIDHVHMCRYLALTSNLL